MSKRVLFLFLLTVAAALATAAWAVGQTLTVQVREVQARSSPSFTGRPSATFYYGQTVSVLEERGAWIKAGDAGGQGWVHKDALTEQQLGLRAGGREVSVKADEREVAAAGKGFTAETERAYRQGHPGGYAQVEEMLRYTCSAAELNAFLKAGNLVTR